MKKLALFFTLLFILAGAAGADANLSLHVFMFDDVNPDFRARFLDAMDYELRRFSNRITVGGDIRIGRYGDFEGGDYMAQCYLVRLPPEINPHGLTWFFAAVNKGRGYLNPENEVVELLSVQNGKLVRNDAVAIFEQTMVNYGVRTNASDLARLTAEFIVSTIADSGDL